MISIFRPLLLIGVLLLPSAPVFPQNVVIRLTRPNFYPTAIELDEPANRLFVADQSSNSIIVYDGTTNTEIAAIPHALPSVSSMVADTVRGKLYASCLCSNAPIAVIDTRLLSATRYITPGYTGNTLTLARDDGIGKVYALSDQNALIQIDTGTDAVIPIPGLITTSRSSINVNPVTHELFLVTFEDSNL